MYLAASHSSLQMSDTNHSHRDLLHHFTGHLVDEEFQYFIHWDRLIDLEADASTSLIARTWLLDSDDRERDSSKCVSSLVFDPTASCAQAVFDESWFARIVFQRSLSSPLKTPLSQVGFEPGCRVVISMDDTSVASLSRRATRPRRVKPQMHIFRGVLHQTSVSEIHVLASKDDLLRIETVVKRLPHDKVEFRIDIEDSPTGVATLRQNLVNLFTGDKKSPETPGSQAEPSRLAFLRDVLIRLRKPRFDRTLVKSMFTAPPDSLVQTVPGCDLMDLCFEFSRLNSDQQAAAEQVCCSFLRRL
jgi:hypothetical protein